MTFRYEPLEKGMNRFEAVPPTTPQQLQRAIHQCFNLKQDLEIWVFHTESMVQLIQYLKAEGWTSVQ